MKQIFYTLLAVSIIFSACKKEDNSSSFCGTATLTVDGVNYTYNNPLPSTTSDPQFCLFSAVSIYNGEIMSFTELYTKYRL